MHNGLSKLLSLKSVAMLVLLLHIAGCALLQVAGLPEEVALPPSNAKFWDNIDSEHPAGWFYLLNSGQEALDWRLKMIDSAQQSIDMETFLWKPDASGRQVMKHIVAAADRGVKVRFLLDDALTIHEDLALHSIEEHPNVSLRLYNPIQYRSNIKFWRAMFNLGEFSRINHRMHNKTLIVDGRAILVGGRNLADEYFGLHDKLNFRDMEVITTSNSVAEVSHHFDAFWNSGWSFPLADVIPKSIKAIGIDDFRSKLNSGESVPFTPDTTALAKEWRAIAQAGLPGHAAFYFDKPASKDPAAADEAPKQLAKVLLQLIDNAESEVILMSAYLVPTPGLEAAVERAEARGVSVRILTNSLRSNNHLAAHAAYRKHIRRLLQHGADLHEVRVSAVDRHLYMQPTIEGKGLGLHAKVLIIDEKTIFIGSCNLDTRSLDINTEVGLVIESTELNSALREKVAIDFLPRNAWAVQLTDDGDIVWRGDKQILTSEPADSRFQRLEDWFLGLLPIDKQM